MPTAFKCPGSVRPCLVEVEAVGEAAETGTAAHACFEQLPRNGAIDWDSIDRICDELEGDSEEVRFLCIKAERMWATLKNHFPSALTEVHTRYDLPSLNVEWLRLSGHIDLFTLTGTWARILDWKTGRLDANYSHQMKAYMAMILEEFPHLEGATATIVWVRTEDVENYTMTRAEAREWLAKFRTMIVDWDGVYHTGDHCGHCRRAHECDAGNELARTYVSAIADVGLHDINAAIATMEPDAAIALYHRAKMVRDIAEKALDALKIRAHAGEIRGTETRLEMQKENRRAVDIVLAWPVLEGLGFTPEDYARVMKMSISKCEQVMADRAPRGEGKAARARVAKLLQQAGAISNNEQFKLIERRNT